MALLFTFFEEEVSTLKVLIAFEKNLEFRGLFIYFRSSSPLELSPPSHSYVLRIYENSAPAQGISTAQLILNSTP